MFTSGHIYLRLLLQPQHIGPKEISSVGVMSSQNKFNSLEQRSLEEDRMEMTPLPGWEGTVRGNTEGSHLTPQAQRQEVQNYLFPTNLLQKEKVKSQSWDSQRSLNSRARNSQGTRDKAGDKTASLKATDQVGNIPIGLCRQRSFHFNSFLSHCGNFKPVIRSGISVVQHTHATLHQLPSLCLA